MPVNVGDLAGGIAEKALEVWWVISSPAVWILFIFSVYIGCRRDSEMARKDIDEWREVNRRKRS